MSILYLMLAATLFVFITFCILAAISGAKRDGGAIHNQPSGCGWDRDQERTVSSYNVKFWQGLDND